jgi:hypothetical protein
MSASTAPATLDAATGSYRVRDRVARVLLVLSALGAALAVVGAASAVVDAGLDTRMVETWRLLGFGVFAGLFVLLAYRPRMYAGVWELAILDKLALAVTAFAYGSATDGAVTALVADGTITIMLLAAYLLSRGWTAWSTARSIR